MSMTQHLDYLFADKVRKDHADVDADEVLSGFKEFLLVFYGAAWSTKSMQVAQAISSYLAEFNPDDDHSAPAAEVLYVSNDTDKREFKDFYSSMVDETSWCTLKWDDPMIANVKDEFRLEALPKVIVLDRNMRMVTEEGADDLLSMEPQLCRTYWIGLLQRQLREHAERRNSSIDE